MVVSELTQEVCQSEESIHGNGRNQSDSVSAGVSAFDPGLI